LTCRSRQNSNPSRWLRVSRAAIGALLLACALPLGGVRAVHAQANGFALPEIHVLTIEPDRLFAGTRFGQRLTKEIEARVSQHAGENRRIEKELGEEEIALTGQRETLSAEEFRALADEFDARVTEARSAQDEKARDISALSEQAQRGFLQAIAPILEQMMNENGASVILDRRAVFLSADASDITLSAIERIDKTLADGSALSELVPGVDAPKGDPEK